MKPHLGVAGQGSEQQPLPPDQDPGHLPGLEESLQRRTMYPAGRILHLVPARLVFDAEQLAKLGRASYEKFRHEEHIRKCFAESHG